VHDAKLAGDRSWTGRTRTAVVEAEGVTRLMVDEVIVGVDLVILKLLSSEIDVKLFGLGVTRSDVEYSSDRLRNARCGQLVHNEEAQLDSADTRKLGTLFAGLKELDSISFQATPVLRRFVDVKCMGYPRASRHIVGTRCVGDVDAENFVFEARHGFQMTVVATYQRVGMRGE